MSNDFLPRYQTLRLIVVEQHLKETDALAFVLFHVLIVQHVDCVDYSHQLVKETAAQRSHKEGMLFLSLFFDQVVVELYHHVAVVERLLLQAEAVHALYRQY